VPFAELDTDSRAALCRSLQPLGALAALPLLPLGPVISMGDVTAIEPSWTFEVTVDERGVVDRVHRISALVPYGREGTIEASLERFLEGRSLVHGLGRPVRLQGRGTVSGWGLELDGCPPRAAPSPSFSTAP
jgi:hypothetical protein